MVPGRPLPAAPVLGAALFLAAVAFAQAPGEWRPASPSRAGPVTYAAPGGELTMTVRCAPSNGYVEQVFRVRGPLDLAASPHGDGQMIDLTIAYRSVGGPGGLTSGQLARVTPFDGGHELVASNTANSLPNLAAGEARPEAFEVAAGGRTFRVPFMPADLAARLGRECDFRWYDRVLGGLGMLFSGGR